MNSVVRTGWELAPDKGLVIIEKVVNPIRQTLCFSEQKMAVGRRCRHTQHKWDRKQMSGNPERGLVWAV